MCLKYKIKTHYLAQFELSEEFQNCYESSTITLVWLHTLCRGISDTSRRLWSEDGWENKGHKEGTCGGALHTVWPQSCHKSHSKLLARLKFKKLKFAKGDRIPQDLFPYYTFRDWDSFHKIYHHQPSSFSKLWSCFFTVTAWCERRSRKWDFSSVILSWHLSTTNV